MHIDQLKSGKSIDGFPMSVLPYNLHFVIFYNFGMMSHPTILGTVYSGLAKLGVIEQEALVGILLLNKQLQHTYSI